MITYDDLKICAGLAREAQNIRDSLERIRSLAEYGGIKSEVVSGFGAPLDDRAGEGAAAIADIERREGAKIAAYVEHVACVEREINGLTNPDHRLILRLRYVDGMTWGQISEKSHFHERWSRELHRRGLDALGLKKETQPTNAG